MRLRDASKTLYYDVKKKVIDQQASLRREKTTLPDDWEEKPAAEPRSNYLMYIAIATLFFFFITVGIAYFVRFAGIDRTVSTSKITMVTQGPTIVDSGSAAPLTIRIANGNPVPIEDVVFTIIYPEGTYRKADTVVRLHRDEFPLGSMESGEVKSKNIAPIFYGVDGQEREITYEVGYRAQGTSQPMRIEDSYQMTLRTTPILLTEPTHTSPVSGKDITFQTSVQSNMKEVIDTAYIQVSYPPGFSPHTFSLPPLNTEKTVWRLSSLKPNESYPLWIRGVLDGRERDEQAFVVGVFVSPTGKLDESVKVAEESVIFAIGRPFIDINLSLNGSDDGNVIVSPGDIVTGRLSWRNLDRERIEDLVITVSLSGNGLNESSVTAKNNGYFNGPLRQVVWDKQRVRSFALVRAGGQGEVSFSFSAVPNRVETAQTQRNIAVSVSAQARRAQTRSVETIDHALQRNISLRGSLQVAANTRYQGGALRNQGPLPPQVGKRTSYSLRYDIKNSSNPIEDFSMKIPLSRDVIFTGQIAGISRDLWTYDKGFHEITIHIPSLTATGKQSARSIEVQVIVEPQESHVGNILTLSKATSWQAIDAYINESLRGTVPSLSTRVLAESLNSAERSGVVKPAT